MKLSVRSEIGDLKKVMLQRPGRELEHLSPATMGELLFDDIPYLHKAQAEHDEFADLLRANGAEVVYLDRMTAEAIAARPEIKEPFIREYLAEAGPAAKASEEALTEYLNAIKDPLEFVDRTMEGIPSNEVFPSGQGRLADYVLPAGRFLVPPMPNLYFTRDPFAVVGCGVSLHHMHTRTRSRETIYGRTIFAWHPDYAVQVPLWYTPEEPFSLEGGDILNLSAKVLAVGVSERSEADAVQRLAERLFSREESDVETVLAFTIPKTRAFMHLDTVFTQVDRDKFTVHPGILPSLKVFALTGRGKGKVSITEEEGGLEEILKRYLGLDRLTLIRCGGGEGIAAEREQWNDGSNTLCIAPGKVIVYDRNYVTNKLLEDAGLTVLKLSGSELSRGRGGPRCMSMPLVRKEV